MPIVNDSVTYTFLSVKEQIIEASEEVDFLQLDSMKLYLYCIQTV